MLYELTDQTIQAIRNVLTVVEESPEQPSTADQLILSQSIDELKRIITAWEHDERMFDCS